MHLCIDLITVAEWFLVDVTVFLMIVHAKIHS